MSIDVSKAASRPEAVARLLGGRLDARDVYSRWVVLAADADSLATRNGRWCFLDSLRLLNCVVGNLAIVLPNADGLAHEVQTIVRKAFSRGERQIIIGHNPAVLASADAVLHVGPPDKIGRECTAIGAQGWIARVSSASCLDGAFDRPNPMAALMAASMGVAEVFKRLVGVPSEVASTIESAELSLFDFVATADSPGPELPASISLPNTLLTGAGALSNGIALLLSQLPVEGRLRIIDKQDYGVENFGTCVLLEREGWLNNAKAERLASWLLHNSKLVASGEKALIGEAISSGALTDATADLVLNGLDDVQARRDTQRLWPSVIIDGGISAVGAAVTQHRLAYQDLACLLCWFEEPKTDEKQRQSRTTGLQVSSLANLERKLTGEDVRTAFEDKRDWLRECQQQSKTICSVIAEAEMKERLGVEASRGFRPSVPFVATASAALVVSEAVKAICFPDAPVVSQFQIGNLFLGPESSVRVRRKPTAGCRCVLHRRLLRSLRTGHALTGLANRA